MEISVSWSLVALSLANENDYLIKISEALKPGPQRSGKKRELRLTCPSAGAPLHSIRPPIVSHG